MPICASQRLLLQLLEFLKEGLAIERKELVRRNGDQNGTDNEGPHLLRDVVRSPVEADEIVEDKRQRAIDWGVLKEGLEELVRDQRHHRLCPILRSRVAETVQAALNVVTPQSRIRAGRNRTGLHEDLIEVDGRASMKVPCRKITHCAGDHRRVVGVMTEGL